MLPSRTRFALFFAAVAAFVLAGANLWALEPGADGYYKTGEGIRVKTIAIVDVNVYRITHSMKQLPPSKSKRAVIEMDTDKKFVLTLLRDVDREKMQTALKDALALNGYTDQGRITKFMSAMTADELKEKSRATIAYSAEKKTTTLTVGGGGTVTVDGVELMKAVWSIWLGKIDQPKLGDQLISQIP
jgi:hypothetical protein